MDLLSGYGSDASSGSDEDAPSINPSVASEKPGPEKPTVAQDGKPNVRKVSLKGLSALLPPPRTAITSGNGTGDSDEEGEEPLWKRLKSSKPTGASLASLLPKPVHDAPAPSRGTINLTDTTPSAPPVAVRPPQVPKPKPAVESAPVREPAPAAAPPSRFKVDFGLSDAAPAPKPAQPSWAPPRVVAIAPVAPSAAASYDPWCVSLKFICSINPVCL